MTCYNQHCIAGELVIILRNSGIVYLGFYFQGNFWGPLPYLVMCALSLAEVIAYCGLIPETKGKPMVERMPGEQKQSIENGVATRVSNGNVEEQEPLKNH